MRLEMIATHRIVDPADPVRASIDELDVHELAQSIAEVGLIQPLVVREIAGEFEVIAGHRRLLACRELQLATIACLVTEDQSGVDVTAARLHENLFRKDMTPVEEAAVYAEAFEKLGDLEKVAALAHRSLAVVERRLALLSGDEDVRTALHGSHISVGVAEELNRVADQTTRRFLLRFAIAEGATVTKVREWRRAYSVHPIPPGAEPERLVTELQTAPVENPAGICWLCGSDAEPHDLRVRMVHQVCERVARASAAERIQRVHEALGADERLNPAADAER